MPNKPRFTRTQARELESKFNPAIKVLSNYMHNMSALPPNFLGIKVPAGTFTKEINGTQVEFQVQAWAVASKKHKIKKNEVVPVFTKKMLWFRFKMFLKYIVEWANK